MKRNISLFIRDILDCMSKIEEFIGDMSFDDFVKDDRTSSAVIRKLEIIGEAVKNIPEENIKKYPQVPWSDMARMRDKIIHFYHGVDYEIIWDVIKDRLPEIKSIIEMMLRDLKGK